jgi:HEAT repeat protein
MICFTSLWLGVVVALLGAEEGEGPMPGGGAGVSPGEKAAALVRAVKEGDFKAADRALRDLNQKGAAEAALPGLLKTLSTESDRKVRESVCKLLARLARRVKDTPEFLKKDLEAKDPTTRAWAAVACCYLRKEDESRLLPLVQEALRSGNSVLRQEAAFARVQLGAPDSKAVSDLVRLLGDGQPEVRLSAALALGDLGPAAKDAVKPLRQALKDDNLEVRVCAAAVLSTIDTGEGPGARLVLLDGLNSKEEQIRSEAVGGLGNFNGDAEVLGKLREALRDRSLTVRLAAITALSRWGIAASGAIPDLTRLLEDPEPEISRSAAGALMDISSEKFKRAVPFLIKGLQHDNENVRSGSANGLGQLGPLAEEAVQPLVSALGDEDEEVRKEAALALGLIGKQQPEVIGALTKRLEDADESVRTSAAAALTFLAPAEKADLVLPILRDGLKHEDAAERRQCIESLGRLGPAAKMAVPDLRHVLDDNAEKDPNVWGAVPLALLSIDREQAWDPVVSRLVDRLKQGSPESRKQAALSLGQLGATAKSAVRDLGKALLADTDAAVRQQVLWTLPLLGPDAAVATPDLVRALGDKDPDVRLWAGITLTGVNLTRAAPAIKVLVEGFEHKDDILRAMAINAAAQIAITTPESPELRNSLPQLEKALKAPNTQVRLSAAFALLKIDPDRARAVARELFDELKNADAATRLEAASSLAVLDPKRAEDTVPVLIDGLREDNRLLRGLAFVGLTELGPRARKAVPALRKVLASEDVERRARAAAALAAIDPDIPRSELLPALRAGLKGDDPGLRERVASTLGQMGAAARTAVPDLIAALQVEKDLRVRNVIIFALGQIGSEGR